MKGYDGEEGPIRERYRLAYGIGIATSCQRPNLELFLGDVRN